MIWFVLFVFYIFDNTVAERYIKVENRNDFPIWIQTLTNNNGTALSNKNFRICPGGRLTYNISDNGWSGRFWPKIGCNRSGNNCTFGQSMDPCPKGGCQPPADTKAEFHFPPINSQQETFYDISLVNDKIT